MGVLGGLGGFAAKVRGGPGVLGDFHEISEKSIINRLGPFLGVICWVNKTIFFVEFFSKNGRKKWHDFRPVEKKVGNFREFLG